MMLRYRGIRGTEETSEKETIDSKKFNSIKFRTKKSYD